MCLGSWFAGTETGIVEASRPASKEEGSKISTATSPSEDTGGAGLAHRSRARRWTRWKLLVLLGHLACPWRAVQSRYQTLNPCRANGNLPPWPSLNFHLQTNRRVGLKGSIHKPGLGSACVGAGRWSSLKPDAANVPREFLLGLVQPG